MRQSVRFVLSVVLLAGVARQALSADPPVVRWQKTIPGCNAVLSDAQGNVFVSAFNYNYDTGQWETPFVRKLDRHGNVLWTRPIPNALGDEGVFLEAVSQHGVWALTRWGAKVHLISDDGQSLQTWNGLGVLGTNVWGKSHGVDSQGRLWVSDTGSSSDPNKESRVACYGPTGLEWVSNPLGHRVSNLWQSRMLNDTLFAIYSTGDDADDGPFRLYKLGANGAAASFPLFSGEATVAELRSSLHAPGADGALIFDLGRGNNPNGVDNRHFITKVTQAGATVWFREVPYVLHQSTAWSATDLDGKVWVPSQTLDSTIRWYDPQGNLSGPAGPFDGSSEFLRFEPSVSQSFALLNVRDSLDGLDVVRLLKLETTGALWTWMFPNATFPIEQTFGANNDILVLADVRTQGGRPTQSLVCLAQVPESTPDAPPGTVAGPSPYRDTSVIDNDRYAELAQISKWPGKGNVWMRPDGTFMYSPWAGVQNTTDSFAYRAKNAGATGAATTVTVQIGAVSQGSVMSLSPNASAIVGGKSVRVRLEIGSAAPAGGLAIAVVSRNERAVRVPDVVIIPAGRQSASFDLATLPVSVDTAVEFFAERTSTRKVASITVRPPQLDSLTSATTEMVGVSNATATTKLTGRAAAGGVLVLLRSNHPSLKVPSSVRVPEGFGSAKFAIKSLGVAAPTSVRVIATLGSRTRVLDLQLSPGS